MKLLHGCSRIDHGMTSIFDVMVVKMLSLGFHILKLIIILELIKYKIII